MNTTEFSALVSRHRNYVRTGATRSVEWREGQLNALRAMMTDRAEDFYASLWTDLRRNRTDADLTDVKYLVTEADHALAHLRDWMKPVPVSTPPMFTPSDAQVRFDPLGVGSDHRYLELSGDADIVPADRRDFGRERRRHQAF